LSPKHLSVHRDNFKVHADVNTPQGKANSDIIKQADIIFFNGGDQIRHIRTWLKDDGTASSLLQVAKDRLIKDDIVGAGTSAGSMIWSNQTYGEGNSFGLLYFRNTVGLAQKKTADG
jgi:cyanophycinase